MLTFEFILVAPPVIHGDIFRRYSRFLAKPRDEVTAAIQSLPA